MPRNSKPKPHAGLPASEAVYKSLLTKVRNALIEGQARIEAERVRIYWETGHLIHAHILKYERAERGQKIVKRLSGDLGVSETVLHRCVKFVRKYPDRRKVAAGPLFSWSHYRKLVAISDDKKRLRLQKAAAREGWSVDELTTRIKEEILTHQKPDRSAKFAAGHQLLSPLRGTVYTYRLVERPSFSPEAQPDLLIDLGFGVYHEIDRRLLSGFGKDEIVESRPQEDACKLHKTERTAKDLFTYAAYVEKIIDGDTLKVRLDLGFRVWTRQVLRLRGLDCPEAGTPEGDEAKFFVRSHLKEARHVIVRSSRADKYDRYLADVFIPQDNESNPEKDIYLNNLLLETGRAGRMV